MINALYATKTEVWKYVDDLTLGKNKENGGTVRQVFNQLLGIFMTGQYQIILRSIQLNAMSHSLLG